MFGFHDGLPMDFAGRIITARFCDTIVILIYAPSKVKENLIFFDILIKHLQLEKKLGLPIILMGDLNIPRTDLDASLVRTWSTAGDDFTHNRKLLEVAIETMEGVDAGQKGHGFTWFPQPNKSTQRRNIGMRVDYIIYDKRLTCESYSVQSLLGGSDHRPITATLSKNTNPSSLKDNLPTTRLSSICPSSQLPLKDEIECIAQFTLLSIKSDLQNSIDGDEVPYTNITDSCGEIRNSFHTFALSKDSSNILIRVEISIGSQRMLALVDTGSTYNLIDKSFAIQCVQAYSDAFEEMNIAPLILGDGITPLKPIGVLRCTAFDFIDSYGKPLSHTSDFVVLDPLDEKLIVGHQFFIQGHASKPIPRHPPGEISYAKQALVFGRKLIPWKYEISGSNFNIAAPLKDQTGTTRSQFLTCLSDTKIFPLSHSSVQSVFSDPSIHLCTKPWGFFSNICPAGSKLVFIECFGHISSYGLTRVWFTNTSSDVIVIPRGRQLCLFEPLDINDHGVFVSPQTLAKMNPRDGTLGRQPATPRSTSQPLDDGILGRLPATPMTTSLPQNGALVSQSNTLTKMTLRDGNKGQQTAPKPHSPLHESIFDSHVILSKMNPKSDCSAKKSTKDIDQTTSDASNITTVPKTTHSHDGDISEVGSPELILKKTKEDAPTTLQPADNETSTRTAMILDPMTRRESNDIPVHSIVVPRIRHVQLNS
jgi:hypothetical protein